MRLLNEEKKCGYEVGDSCGCPGDKEGEVKYSKPKGNLAWANACAKAGLYCSCGRYWDHTDGGRKYGNKITVRESELISLIKRTINESQLLTEDIKCHVRNNPCEKGTCKFDPNSNEMCCVEDNQYGCMKGDGRFTGNDTNWLRDDYSDYHMMEPCDKGDHCCECQNTGDEYTCCLCTGECKDYRFMNHSRINESQLLNEDWVKTCCDERWVGFGKCCDIIEDRDSGLIGPDWGNGRGNGQRRINEKGPGSNKELKRSPGTNPVQQNACADPLWLSLPAGGTQGTPTYNGGKNNYCDRCDASSNPTFPVIISNNTWQYSPSSGTNYCPCC